METEKPFVCTVEGCTMKFTNEDHLTVHTKKHTMVLHLSVNQKTPNFVDQTPTPTRLIKNCDEVGLFEDLQHVNPFDETFRRAVESKSNDSTPTHILPSDPIITEEEETLHTPHVLPFSVCGEGTAINCRKKLRIYTKSKIDISSSQPSAVSDNLICKEELPTVEHNHEQNGKKIENVSEMQSNETAIIITNLPLQSTSQLASTIHLTTATQSIPILNQIQLGRFHHQLNAGFQIRSNDCPPKSTEINVSKKQLPILPKPFVQTHSQGNNLNSIREKIKEALKRKPKLEITNNSVNVDDNGNRNSNSMKKSVLKTTSDNTEKTANISERNREAAKRYRKKLKGQYSEIQTRCRNLEAQNDALKMEVMELRTILATHQNCSVTKKLNGQTSSTTNSISMNIPAIIVKNSNGTFIGSSTKFISVDNVEFVGQSHI